MQYTTRQAAEKLGVSYATIRNWVNWGLITPSVKTQYIFLFTEDDLANRTPPPRPGRPKGSRNVVRA
jgi:DNA-binding transcriptional MerR regulator